MTKQQKHDLKVEITENMCDEKCKMPDECSSQEELDNICSECPLNKIWNL